MNTLDSTVRFVAGNLAIVVLVGLLIWESFWPYLDHFRQAGGRRWKHGLRNLALGAANALLNGALFAALWAWAAHQAAAAGIGLLHWSPLGIWVEALFAVLLLDLWTYVWHRANHEIPFLWRFHQVHHSDPQMDVTTASRFHLGEIFFSSLLRIGIIFAIGAELWHLALYEALMFTIVQFHHANVGLPARLDRLLRVVIVTPAMHKIHHSREPGETHSNYTSLLSCWDRFFGSFRMRNEAGLHQVRFGLRGRDGPQSHQLRGLMRMPWTKLDPGNPPRNRL